MPNERASKREMTAADVMFDLGMIWGDRPHVFGVIHNTIRQLMIIWGGFGERERRAAEIAVQEMTYQVMLTAAPDSKERINRLHPNDFIPVLINDRQYQNRSGFTVWDRKQ